VDKEAHSKLKSCHARVGQTEGDGDKVEGREEVVQRRPGQMRPRGFRVMDVKVIELRKVDLRKDDVCWPLWKCEMKIPDGVESESRKELGDSEGFEKWQFWRGHQGER
jgi:hypothetical protein